MALHLLDHQDRQGLASCRRIRTIVLLSMDNTRSEMARVKARKCRATGLGGCHRTQGMRAAYSQSTRASTGSVLLRSPSDSAKRRARRGLMTLISTWRCACKVIHPLASNALTRAAAQDFCSVVIWRYGYETQSHCKQNTPLLALHKP